MQEPTGPRDTGQGQGAPLEVPRASALPELFARLLSGLASATGVRAGELALLDADAGVRTLAWRRGSEEPNVRVGRRTREDYSASLWPPAAGVSEPIWTPTAALDSSRACDRAFAEIGDGSVASLPLAAQGEFLGMLFLARRGSDADPAATGALLSAAAGLLATAAAQERHWGTEEVRLRRRAKLEALLPTIAESLDIRRVFVAMSQVIQEVIPHDVLAFALLTPDRGGVRVQAATHQGVRELPEYRFSNAEEALDSNWRYLLAFDLAPVSDESVRARISPRGVTPPLEVVVQPGAAWMRFVTQAGIRSTLRVPIRSQDRPIGGVVFMSRSADAYGDEDGILASRIADHVALALAYHELADEERRIAVSEERARLLEGRVEALSRELERYSAHRALGESPSWKKALADAAQVAPTETTVLVTGESGTGKEVVARFLHRGSKRSKGPFVALNCAALPEQLLESELFGHERGAFTGAVESRAGKIEQAAGGTLFLDEVGEMSPAVQAKFLRVLQEREFQRVGGSRTLKADVRIVAATNRDPRAAVAAGTFREDLYYRLGVFEIHLAPLRERREDILLLAEAFLEEIGRSIGRPAAGLSEDAREMLLAHGWPGNVRELRNAVERAAILCQGGLVTREHLPITLSRPMAERVEAATSPEAAFPAEGVPLDSVERDLVVKAMAKAGQNKSQAAKLLGVSRGQLYSLLRRHGLTDAKR